MTDCLFCGIVAGDVPADIVRSDERTVAFRDINPQAPVHVLIVPRRHITNASTVTAADAEDVTALLLAAQQVAAAEGIAGEDRGYRLVFNVGPDALQFGPSPSSPPAGWPHLRLAPGLSGHGLTARRPLVGSSAECTWNPPRSKSSSPAIT